MRGISGDLKQQQATAVVLLGVIAAEFQGKHEDKKPKRRSSTGKLTSDDVELDSVVIQDTAKSLEMLLLERVSDRYTVNSPIRRAMADLMGRGFKHWANHVHAATVLLFLLELSCETSSRLSSYMSEMSTSELLRSQPNATTCQIARHALVLCAMARPIVFISTVAKEIDVVQPTSFSPGGIPGSPREAGNLAIPPHEKGTLGMKSIVQRAKKAIIHVLETLTEKMQEDVILQLVDVVDILVHCYEPTYLKTNGLSKLFPSILRFNLVSYCHGPRRLAVGSRRGQVALYELKSAKCQVITAHACPITAVSFTTDGRFLAAYSIGDSKITVWQVAWSFLGLSSVPKLLMTFPTIASSPKSVSQLLKTVSLVWVSHKKLVLMIDDKEQQFSL
jgi:hypothetical protein